MESRDLTAGPVAGGRGRSRAWRRPSNRAGTGAVAGLESVVLADIEVELPEVLSLRLPGEDVAKARAERGRGPDDRDPADPFDRGRVPLVEPAPEQQHGRRRGERDEEDARVPPGDDAEYRVSDRDLPEVGEVEEPGGREEDEADVADQEDRDAGDGRRREPGRDLEDAALDEQGAGLARISYATDEDALREAIEIMGEAAAAVRSDT